MYHSFMGRSGRTTTGSDLFYGSDIKAPEKAELPPSIDIDTTECMEELASMISELREEEYEHGFTVCDFRPNSHTKAFTFWTSEPDGGPGPRFEVSLLIHHDGAVALEAKRRNSRVLETVYIGTSIEDAARRCLLGNNDEIEGALWGYYYQHKEPAPIPFS